MQPRGFILDSRFSMVDGVVVVDGNRASRIEHRERMWISAWKNVDNLWISAWENVDNLRVYYC